MASILTNLEPGDILFIDEIHRLNKVVEETLYPAMEDYALDIVIGKGPSARTLRLDLPQFTIVGATTRIGLLSSPIRDRFGVVSRLSFYAPRDLEHILEKAAQKLAITLHDAPKKNSPNEAAARPASPSGYSNAYGMSRRWKAMALSPKRFSTVHSVCWKSMTWAWMRRIEDF